MSARLWDLALWAVGGTSRISPGGSRTRGRGWDTLVGWQSRSVSAPSMSCTHSLRQREGSGVWGLQGECSSEEDRALVGCSTYWGCAGGCGVVLRQAPWLQAQKGSRASTHSPQLRYRLQLEKGT